MRVIAVVATLAVAFSSTVFGQVVPLDLSQVRQVAPAPNFVEELLIKYLPKSLSPTANKDEAQRQLEKGVTHNVGEDLLSSSRLAVKVKKISSPSLNIVSSTKANVPAPLHLGLDATRALASLNYVGDFNSALSFVGRDKNFQFIVSKEMSHNTFISFKEETPITGFDFSSKFEFGYVF